MRVKIVISRFGDSVIGGAEKHCSDFIKILPKDWEIEILTTTARDYITWKNEFKKGIELWNGYKINRFPVEKHRDINKFNRLTDKLQVIFPNQNIDMEKEWLIKQGPYSPSLVDAIHNSEKSTDFYLFFSYLYYPTVIGMDSIQHKSALVPMLHDEFPAYLSIYKKCFDQRVRYIFNSPEESDLFTRIFNFTPNNKTIIGTYVNLPQINTPTKDEYFLSIGRMDIGKGFRDLVEMFSYWSKKTGNKIPLKIIGKNPPHTIKKFTSEHIEFLGYLDEDEKERLIANSKFLINPSAMESFSIVLMESWSFAIPVLVNAKSKVLQGHCRRSNGGLYYSDLDSFCKCMDYMTANDEKIKKMGINGRKYVELNFTKEIVQNKLVGFLTHHYMNS